MNQIEWGIRSRLYEQAQVLAAHRGKKGRLEVVGKPVAEQVALCSEHAIGESNVKAPLIHDVRIAVVLGSAGALAAARALVGLLDAGSDRARPHSDRPTTATQSLTIACAAQ
jgi:hypothetical protein